MAVLAGCPVVVGPHTRPPELVQQTQGRNALYCFICTSCTPQVVEQAMVGGVVGGTWAVGKGFEALMGKVELLLGGERSWEEHKARMSVRKNGSVVGLGNVV